MWFPLRYCVLRKWCSQREPSVFLFFYMKNFSVKVCVLRTSFCVNYHLQSKEFSLQNEIELTDFFSLYSWEILSLFNPVMRTLGRTGEHYSKLLDSLCLQLPWKWISQTIPAEWRVLKHATCSWYMIFFRWLFFLSRYLQVPTPLMKDHTFSSWNMFDDIMRSIVAE